MSPQRNIYPTPTNAQPSTTVPTPFILTTPECGIAVGELDPAEVADPDVLVSVLPLGNEAEAEAVVAVKAVTTLSVVNAVEYAPVPVPVPVPVKAKELALAELQLLPSSSESESSSDPVTPGQARTHSRVSAILHVSSLFILSGYLLSPQSRAH